MSTFNFYNALASDVPQLVAIVNCAYRGGDGSEKGWTTESHLVSGKRIDEPSLLAQMQKPGTTIRKCLNNSGEIVGCVSLEENHDCLHLGLLTVAPDLQDKGIGRLMLNDAENFAASQNFKEIVIDVLSMRTELIDWYIRRGFVLTGETIPFPTHLALGNPLQPLELVVIKKQIRR